MTAYLLPSRLSEPRIGPPGAQALAQAGLLAAQSAKWIDVAFVASHLLAAVVLGAVLHAAGVWQLALPARLAGLAVAGALIALAMIPAVVAAHLIWARCLVPAMQRAAGYAYEPGDEAPMPSGWCDTRALAVRHPGVERYLADFEATGERSPWAMPASCCRWSRMRMHDKPPRPKATRRSRSALCAAPVRLRPRRVGTDMETYMQVGFTQRPPTEEQLRRGAALARRRGVICVGAKLAAGALIAAATAALAAAAYRLASNPAAWTAVQWVGFVALFSGLLLAGLQCAGPEIRGAIEERLYWRRMQQLAGYRFEEGDEQVLAWTPAALSTWLMTLAYGCPGVLPYAYRARALRDGQFLHADMRILGEIVEHAERARRQAEVAVARARRPFKRTVHAGMPGTGRLGTGELSA